MRVILTCLMIVLAGAAAFAQNITVRGMVKDANTGEGIPYASVQVKGTMTGTATDGDGSYTIVAPMNATLVFSSIGYVTQETAIDGRAVIDILMASETESLEETVVVAYGTAKKSSFTGSATAVKSESLNKRTVSNVSKAIEGLVAGVTSTAGSGQPGESASLHIRGYGSINASSTPLYVVDGIPYDGALSAINPNDIENLTVLKDASYFAIKSVQLGYTLPQKATSKIGLKQLRIFATGDNIRMFNKLNGMDPQYNFSGGTSWAYTPTRTFSLGLDINF